MSEGRLIVLATPEEFMQSDDPLARAYLETLTLA
jgi:hypothetical protein